MGYITFYRLRLYISENVPKPSRGTISFLWQSDCEGKLNHKECRMFLKDIRNLKDNGTYYGYTARGTEACLTITKLKQLLSNCIIYRRSLRWR